MKEKLITEITQSLLQFLDNGQLGELRRVLIHCLDDYEISKATKKKEQDSQNIELSTSFLAAKRIEGCSEKTITYYQNTIGAALAVIDKEVKNITTDDLRAYLTKYQTEKKTSKVTIDNIRRILSSFFSWMEDEDYIIKSPVRRIHKIKTGKVIKETYSDESLELMRDSCIELRDVAMIDLLAST